MCRMACLLKSTSSFMCSGIIQFVGWFSYNLFLTVYRSIRRFSSVHYLETPLWAPSYSFRRDFTHAFYYSEPKYGAPDHTYSPLMTSKLSYAKILRHILSIFEPPLGSCTHRLQKKERVTVSAHEVTLEQRRFKYRFNVHFIHIFRLLCVFNKSVHC